MPPPRRQGEPGLLPRFSSYRGPTARAARAVVRGLVPARRPGVRPPLVTYCLIGLCVLVFLVSPLSGLDPAYGTGHAQLCAQARYFDRWGVIPVELWHGTLAPASLGLPSGCPVPARMVKVPFLSVLTSLFVHGGWAHLLGNMLFLYVFGAGVEERMGRARFAVFYVVTGYVATYGYALGHQGSAQTLVGASGAISGVLGAYLFLHPSARVTSLFPFLLFLPLRFPAWVVLAFWFGLQWIAARTEQAGPAVAYLAHVTGFVFGFAVTAALFRPRSKLAPQAATRGEGQP
ncbi:rhomboid family intramembrane serine protease [Streptomyces sp. ICBB 8177]|uniref:rhomboid family intramembrane serine protease n=1 Tax=Streptomyces sp. ICBB 8177 TaxID=563922 RepID=UPI000D67DCAC|nr:rhomboid family intramembrane serine protease [Streptomyces sp. ICBB 8177]PWI43360.1 rhomboid family intramembrane serine protease [Streptomyces sp. ICBB 8177]